MFGALCLQFMFSSAQIAGFGYQCGPAAEAAWARRDSVRRERVRAAGLELGNLLGV
jgi:hypothetical protein